MQRFLPIAIILLTIAATPAKAADACSIDSMPAARKHRILSEYTRLKQTQGQAQADAFVKQQGVAYYRELAAKGLCSSSSNTTTRRAEPAPKPKDNRPLNRYGKPCRRTELENQNVPNVGGSMGWALVQVCKD
ncbi:hypothetical protein [Sphingomonas immobilis]|uniref:Uncharacterized protein n=1 Tax=Sphingomonas immobilis TaxID=3063997 RepID=A0ABT8ZYY2_9SPHN|nr:hypothetical protein [Sphingomonas sp. CA1-15]MDO7842493.1 hypothetical protein [Sphingomonas sp. CA1-15]